MNIIIAGCGHVGLILAQQLSLDGHDVTVIDSSEEAVAAAEERADVIGILGSGTSIETLERAGVRRTDLLIAVTYSDEVNLLICLAARKLGAGNTIARVRKPEYDEMIPHIKEELGLSMAVNPDAICADEMVRVLKFPSMIKIDLFAEGRAEFLEFDVPDNSEIAGIQLKNLWKYHPDILVCAVMKKDGSVLIPSGEYEIEASDRLEIAGSRKAVLRFFKSLGIRVEKIRNVVIAGGDRIAYYLCRSLVELGIHIKIIEKNRRRCLELAEKLPEAEIICGDCTDQQFLIEEGADRAGAFVSLTGIDEQNIMMSMYIRSISAKTKVLTRIAANPFSSLLPSLDLGSVFYPYMTASEQIIRFVRAMNNSGETSEVEALFQIMDEKVQALEFTVGSSCSFINTEFRKLHFRKNVLVSLICRNGQILIPRGGDMLFPGDRTVITTTGQIYKLEDIIEK